MKTLEELKALRVEKLAAMQTLNDANAEMGEAETVAYAKLEGEFEKLERDIKLSKTEAKLAGEVDDIIVTASQEPTAQLDYRNSFDNYVAGKNVGEAMNEMTIGVDADGGFTVPESYQETVITKLNALSSTRSISSVIGTTSTRNIPTEGVAPTFAWIDEGAAYGETDSSFGNKVLKAYKLGGIIKVSDELLKDTMIGFESYMAGQIALGIDKAESPAFAIGDGVNKPTGYATTATVGASSTTAAVNAITADEIIDIFYDLKAEYRAGATWRMNDNTLKALDKLKDGQGNYILTSLKDGGQPTIKGRPVVVDNSLPDMATGVKFIVLGDFSSYQIADRGEMTIQRLNERYADTGMVGFRVTVRLDAKTTLEEAFNAGQNA